MGNVFGRICLCVYLSIQTITFESLYIETFFGPEGRSIPEQYIDKV